MAKWGEGDPRWIVEERPDATNVNNWHWTEKNATSWSQTRLTDLLVGVRLLDDNNSSDGIAVTITAIDKCEGEAYANNRKGKLIIFYEWVLELSWEGRKVSSGTADASKEEDNKVVSGKIKIPNLSEEQNIGSELDVQYTLNEDAATLPNAAIVKEQLYRDNAVSAKLKQLLQQYVNELKEEYGKDLIKPTAGAASTMQTTKDPDSGGATTSSSVRNKKKPFSSAHVNSSTMASSSSAPSNSPSDSKSQQLRSLTLVDKFRCTAEELFNALTVPNMVIAMCKDARAVCEPKPGGRFSLFGDNVSGQFVELNAPKRITMKWRRKNWPEGVFSDVFLDISQNVDDGQTTLTVTQNGVPENDFEQTEEGWKRYYFHSIKSTFGFGSFLF